MGFWLLQAYCEEDTPICEEIKKLHKFNKMEVVKKYYIEMLDKIAKEETKDCE